MAVHDDRTPNRNYPLPHPDNLMAGDVGRIRETLGQVDGDIQVLNDDQNTTSGTVSRHLFEIEIKLWE
ncbi:MAG: hypothetical protein HQL67_11040 [Magnetococcales bacterium]|nr:hypothetical protein [Magnetococcales bacterium]